MRARRLSVKSRSFEGQRTPLAAEEGSPKSTDAVDDERMQQRRAERQYRTQLAQAQLFGRPMPDTPQHLIAQPTENSDVGGGDGGGGDAALRRYVSFARGARRDAMHSAMHALARAAADGSGVTPSDAQTLSCGQFLNFLRDCHLLGTCGVCVQCPPSPPQRRTPHTSLQTTG